MQTLIEQCGTRKCKATHDSLPSKQTNKQKVEPKNFDPPVLQHSDKR